MSANRGFIALAAIIFGKANPIGTFFAALLFGFFDALGTRLQVIGIPSQFTQMIPYLATIFALVIVTRRQMAKMKKDSEGVKSIES
jgi:simple sugar transport system permease protein